MEVSDERVVELVIKNDVRRAKVELVYTRDLIWVINVALATEELFGRGKDVVNMLLAELAKLEVRAILSIGGSMVATALMKELTPLMNSMQSSMLTLANTSGREPRIRYGQMLMKGHISAYKKAFTPYIITPAAALA